MKRNRLLAALLAAALLLTACGGGTSSSGSASSEPEEPDVSAMAPVEPEPEPEPEFPFTNPLTGEGLDTDIGQNRPVAVMINNLAELSLPQLGVSQADIIYELLAEGGITRMMALFQSVEDVGEIGTVRSARDYYVSLALGHDALFVHAGGSPQAYLAIRDWGVDNFDGVNGPYGTSLFWRDPDRMRNKGMEHSVLTSGEKITALFPTLPNLRLTHKESFTEPLAFMDPDETAQGRDANKLTVVFSYYKTGVFTYDPASGLYRIEEYGDPYIDGNTGEQVAVRNVLVLFTDVASVQGDDKGRQTIRTTGTGKGLFLCDGKVQDITWSKASESAPMSYRDASGQPLKFGVGHSYINIVDGSAQVTVE